MIKSFLVLTTLLSVLQGPVITANVFGGQPCCTVDGVQCVDSVECNESRYNCKLICQGDYVEMRGQEVTDVCCSTDGGATCLWANMCSKSPLQCQGCGGAWVFQPRADPSVSVQQCCTLDGLTCDAVATDGREKACVKSLGGEWVYENNIVGTAEPTSSPTMVPITDSAVLTCGSPGTSLPIASFNDNTIYQFQVSQGLCSLYAKAQQVLKPVARSYNGEAWEAYAGDFAALTFSCDGSSGICATKLPPLEAGYAYELRAFEHSLNEEAKIARFFERASFGANLNEIETFKTNYQVDTDGPAQWIKEQMETVEMTSHRAFFRSHANDRYELPSYQGVTTQPCEVGTRYRRYAFTQRDREAKYLEIQLVSPGRYKFLIDGHLRTVILAELTYWENSAHNVLAPGVYDFCSPDIQGGVGNRFRITINGRCEDLYFNDERLGNFPVYFDATTPPEGPVLDLNGHVTEVPQPWYTGDSPDVQELIVSNPLDENACESIPKYVYGWEQVPNVIATYNGKYYLHDTRFKTFDNTVDKPKMNAGGDLVDITAIEEPQGNDRYYQVLCFNAPMSFLNEEGCKISEEEHTCVHEDFGDAIIELSYENMEKIYLASEMEGNSRYVYAIDGLRQEPVDIVHLDYGSPCSASTKSRWMRVDDCTPSVSVDSHTATIFANMIDALNEDGLLRDVIFPATGVSCHNNDVDKFNFVVQVGNECFKNVHQDHLQVFDFTEWVTNHPGGPEKIMRWATTRPDSPFRIQFPDETTGNHHEMWRWHSHAGSLSSRIELGRLGDLIRFRDLPQDAQTREVARALNAQAYLQRTGPKVVCGSPNEVATAPELYGELGRGAFSMNTEIAMTAWWELELQSRQTWNEVALHANDSLRQRVAWALSQIFAISLDDVGNHRNAEPWVNYYDVFVRNAFGNYWDILKEVSYSPMMAVMLTYMDSQSTQYLFRTRTRVEFADENYAREIMQLFSVGLNLLDIDGTKILDSDGQPILTYTNDEISEYARVWTGFRRPARRGNIEARESNALDPMYIRLDYRDHLPKMGLNGKYIGDGMPLCADLPDKHFLKQGASYRLLGSHSFPDLHVEPEDWAASTDVVRLQLSESSDLYRLLCNPDGSGTCDYRGKIVLDSDIACHGMECGIDTPRVIDVGGIFYEYVRMPCVNQAFFNEGRALKPRWWMWSCGDPRLEIGGIACCPENHNSWDSFDHTDERWHRFSGERVRLATAERVCADHGLVVCTRANFGCNGFCDSDDHEYWSGYSCGVQAKLDLDGTVAVVHAVDEAETYTDYDDVLFNVRSNTKTFFHVAWETPIEENLLSDYAGTCTNLGCQNDPNDNLCLCDAHVKETVAFTTPPTREQVLNDLYVGAFSPTFYQPGLIIKDLENGVKMYSQTGSRYSMDTIFEVIDDFGVTRYKKNLKSTVVIGDRAGLQLRFRNPNHVISVTDPTIRDAQYETDAALDHYFYHQNVAPFLAIRFSQRFGISNPSPRFVKTIATAFKTGTYTDSVSGISFGSGKYGDLGAMVAALLLDREARSEILDADPAHGSLQEPLLRLFRILRSLEYTPVPTDPILTFYEGLTEIIGQEAHRIPNVFSFFLPEYQSSGRSGLASLTCPECQVLTGPYSVGLMNGITSMFEFGLEEAFGGFSYDLGGSSWNRRVFDTSMSRGQLAYSPDASLSNSQVLDQLAILLTSGRLSQEKRDELLPLFDTYSREHATVTAAMLMTTTPEFHATGLVDTKSTTREVPSPPPPSGKAYKNVVFIMLEGAYDSYNMLVPHECTGTNVAGVDVRTQYESVRGEMAFTESEHRSDREISVDPATSNTQPCSKFVVHPELPILKELYDADELTFFANLGVVNTADMNKDNYNTATKTQLFAHNTMQKETKTVDPYQDLPGSGVLGRLSDVLLENSFSPNSISIDNPSVAVSKFKDGNSPTSLIVSRFGASKFYERFEDDQARIDETLSYVARMNKNTEEYSSFFGEAWSEEFMNGIEQQSRLKTSLEATSLLDNGWGVTDWSYDSSLADQLAMVSRLMQTRDTRGVDRDVFYTSYGGWDHHSQLKNNLGPQFRKVNHALTTFRDELVAQGLYESTTVVVLSEFARTLTPNGNLGSDHAWGGNYFMFGGAVDGGKILGEYPSDLTEEGPLNLGRGRIMPTTAWDCVWNGIVQWMGANSDIDLDYVLPNRDKVIGGTDITFTPLFQESDLFKAARRQLVNPGDNGNPASAFPLGPCEGDCDSDNECAHGLICYQRDGFHPVPGCSGHGEESKDYCIDPGPLFLVSQGNNIFGPSNELKECEGDCDGDSDCEGELKCFQRSGFEPVPGCLGDGISGTDYCYKSTTTPIPWVFPECGSVSISYLPGEGSVIENNLQLSIGLTSRILATTNEQVPLVNGQTSSSAFHARPDGAAVFSRLETEGWVYVSNSETTDGGVGALYFDSDGELVDYKMLLSGTNLNCGGGATWWNTWLTCEESTGGQVWEVDPWDEITARQTLAGVPLGARYESAAYDNRDPSNPTFYITTDEYDGPLVRFTPSTAAVVDALASGVYTNLLHTEGAGLSREFLVLTYDTSTTGTFAWSTIEVDGRASAGAHFRNSEGIDITDGKLYMTTKRDHLLFILDLDTMTFTQSSTSTGAFNSQPDQVARILDNDGILYFCEDGSEHAGVHGRDSTGKFYTILQAANSAMSGETTGLAFSPDNKSMYVSYQSPGKIVEVRRTDGCPFNGQRLDIKYHEDDTNFIR